MIKRALPMLALAVSLASTNMTAHAQSKGDQALLDALVRKGVLTEKEAEEISAETAKEAVDHFRRQDPDWRLGARIEAQRRFTKPVSSGSTDADDPDKSVVGASGSSH